MSNWGIYSKVIEQIKPHPNADRLELCKLEGNDYQFVIPKDRYSIGDRVFYFPIDTVLPESLQEKLGIESKRIRTIKLRKEISQGVIAKPEEIIEDWDNIHYQHPDMVEAFNTGKDTDFSFLFACYKYEPPVHVVKGAKLTQLPEYNYVYDLENAENYPKVLEQLMDVPVMVTEKLEGSHFSCTLYADDTFAVCQRRHEIKPDEQDNKNGTNTWLRLAQEYDLENKLKAIRANWYCMCEAITLRGEVIGNGIACGADNIYGLSDQKLYMFELEVDGEPVDAIVFSDMCHYNFIPQVPILSIGMEQTLRNWLDGKNIKEASHGQTGIITGTNSPVLREGIVIKPLFEIKSEEKGLPKGRLMLKQRDPIYLEKTKQ